MPHWAPHAASACVPAAGPIGGRWSGRWDSNPRHPAWKAGALPLSYSRNHWPFRTSRPICRLPGRNTTRRACPSGPWPVGTAPRRPERSERHRTRRAPEPRARPGTTPCERLRQVPGARTNLTGGFAYLLSAAILISGGDGYASCHMGLAALPIQDRTRIASRHARPTSCPYGAAAHLPPSRRTPPGASQAIWLACFRGGGETVPPMSARDHLGGLHG